MTSSASASTPGARLAEPSRAFTSSSDLPAPELLPELLFELKVRARVRLKELAAGVPDVMFYARWISRRRRWELPTRWKLTHALNIVCTELGFHDWAHARQVLAGPARPFEDDLGGLWYDLRCQLLLNHWFADYAQARAFCHEGAHAAAQTRFLFPYARQYVVGDEHYVRLLGLDPASPLWGELGHDLAAGHGTPAWRALCQARLAATRGRLPIGQRPGPRNL